MYFVIAFNQTVRLLKLLGPQNPFFPGRIPRRVCISHVIQEKGFKQAEDNLSSLVTPVRFNF